MVAIFILLKTISIWIYTAKRNSIRCFEQLAILTHNKHFVYEIRTKLHWSVCLMLCVFVLGDYVSKCQKITYTFCSILAAMALTVLWIVFSNQIDIHSHTRAHQHSHAHTHIHSLNHTLVRYFICSLTITAAPKVSNIHHIYSHNTNILTWR